MASLSLSSSKSNESLIAQMEVEIASCPICCNRMHSRTNIPRILSCLHTFCSECLSHLATKEAGVLTCPSCRSSTKCTDVKQLAQNFTLNRMLEILEIQESQQFECDECDEEGANATSRCVECSKYLCKECSKFHERRKATKQHSLLSIAEFKQNAQELHRPNSFFSVNCTRHSGEELKLYCETCEQLICRDCTMIDHTRPDHRYIFVHEAGASHRMQIVAALKRTVDRIPYVEQLIKSADDLMIDIDNRCRDVETEVRTCLQQQRYQLQIREEQLVDSIRQMRAKKEKILSSHREALQLYLANVKSSCDFTNRILEEGTQAEVLATKVQIKRQLELLSERQLSEKPSVDGSLHFYANTQALSEIIDSFASVTASSSFPPLCQVVGDGVESGVVGEETHFSIITFDQEGEKRTKGGDLISVRVERPSETKGSGIAFASISETQSVKVKDNSDGTYSVTFTPVLSGVVFIHVAIQVTPISSSPFKVILTDPDNKGQAVDSEE